MKREADRACYELLTVTLEKPMNLQCGRLGFLPQYLREIVFAFDMTNFVSGDMDIVLYATSGAVGMQVPAERN